jgi:hypothetical protein
MWQSIDFYAPRLWDKNKKQKMPHSWNSFKLQSKLRRDRDEVDTSSNGA